MSALWWQCGAAVGGRLLLAAAGGGEALLWRPEVSTPANSLLKTREGVRLLQLGVSPYAGTSCHVPPLWLALSAPWAAHPVLYVLPSIACDLVAAGALYGAAAAVLGGSSRSRSSSSSRGERNTCAEARASFAQLKLTHAVVCVRVCALTTTPACFPTTTQMCPG